MTHDELLAKMKELSRTFAYESNLNFESALRAVVELHKPHDKYEGVCSGCYEEESGFSDYPCPTIEAIQRGLE